MLKVLAVFVGGGAGALLRYLIAIGLPTASTSTFPWNTFITNVLGCFFIGLLFSLFQLNGGSSILKLFIVIGVLGGFTTFSSFAMEFVTLYDTGETAKAFLYVLASNLIGLVMAFAGLLLGNVLFK